MMIMYCILAVFTLIYLVLAAFMDLKERMIFVFPIVVLHALWSTYLLFSGVYDSTFLSVYWIVNLIVYLLLNHFGIWGGGDSDLFLLMGNVCLGAGATMNGYMVTILECMCLCVGLGISMITDYPLLGYFIFSLVSFLFTYIGLKFGKFLNDKFGKYAVFLGAVILIILGLFYIF